MQYSGEEKIVSIRLVEEGKLVRYSAFYPTLSKRAVIGDLPHTL